MKLPELMVVYALVGAGCALVAIARGAHHAVDALLLLGFWPLYGPFLMLQADPPAATKTDDVRESAFLDALRRASGSPLGKLFPDEESARALASRVRMASARVAEIDALLLRPEFSEEQTLHRQEELRARGASERALATTANRLHNIRHLRGLRNRFASELDEVAELLAQLTTQAEIVRLAGELDAGTAQLVRELVHRVEGLDEFLAGDLAAAQ